MNELITLPFDSAEDNIKEYSAAQRRMLYHDLWSDMILERFTFENVGDGNFIVNGVAIVGGAYARFNNFRLSTTGVQVGWTHLVLRVVPDDRGGETVGLRFAASAITGDLRVGTATVQAGPQVTSIVGIGPSPIRIPDRTIVSDKLADNSVVTRTIANGQVTNAKLADGINAGRLTVGILPIARIANNSITATQINSDTFMVTDIINGATARTLLPNESRTITFTVPTGYYLIGARPRNNQLSINGGSRTGGSFSVRNVSSSNVTIAAGTTYATLLFVRSGAQHRVDQTRQIPAS